MSSAFLVYVVACRPYAEKVMGGMAATYEAPLQADGVFFLDEPTARRCAEMRNRSDGIDSWRVYPAHITVNPDAAPCMSYCKIGQPHEGECEPMEGR